MNFKALYEGEAEANKPDSRTSEHPSRLRPPSQSSPLATSPSDIADPSPISTSSNSTDTTNIDETEVQHEESEATPQPPRTTDAEPPDVNDGLTRKLSDTSQNGERAALQLETKHAAENALKPRSDEDEQPSSVIHAPLGFDAFVRDPSRLQNERRKLITVQAGKRQSPPSVRRTTPTPSQPSESSTAVSQPEENAEMQKVRTGTRVDFNCAHTNVEGT